MTTKTLEKLIKIEQELLNIKKEGGLILPKVFISLRGILKGVKITENDIVSAKLSYD